jgi:hypothetical protein
MNTLRLLLTLLLSLALPINGYAALVVVTPCCPMQPASGMASMPTGQPCCCHPDERDTKHRAPCKCDQTCKTSNTYPATVAYSVFFPFVYQQSVLQVSVQAISFDASGVWRPPRLL